MTKKNYVDMANRLRILRGWVNVWGKDIPFWRVVEEMESFFKADNPAFDKDKFERAIYDD